MATHFFNAVNIPAENCHIPQSTAAAHEEFCEKYEAAIVNAGGIDIQVLGIGKRWTYRFLMNRVPLSDPGLVSRR